MDFVGSVNRRSEKIFHLNELEFKYGKLKRNNSDLSCLAELIDFNQGVLEGPLITESWLRRQYGRQAGYLVEMVNESPEKECSSWLSRLVELLQDVDRRYAPTYRSDDKRKAILSIRAFLASGKRMCGSLTLRELPAVSKGVSLPIEPNFVCSLDSRGFALELSIAEAAR